MQGLRARELLDLAAAREAARDEQRLRRRMPDRREEHALRASHRHVEMCAFVAPRAGHAAAAALRRLDDEPDALEQLLLGLEPVRRPPVTVTVQEGAAHELRRLVAVFT